jgi:hypothetical protein
MPQSKHVHLIAAPLNVFFHRLSKPGKLEEKSIPGVKFVEMERKHEQNKL